MISLWIVIGLILAATTVASLAALFSVVGLAALFSGAWLAVCAMAGALEFSKFVLAAYLHQQWDRANKLLKVYLSFAIIILSLITSMGIFGFLSDAYQSASHELDTENFKLTEEKTKQTKITEEIARLTRSVDEIPDTRITKKLKARAEIEPMIRDLNKQHKESTQVATAINLKVLEIKKKVGPLIYIARAFNIDIDTTVKYLIFVFVLVFDPLAICLVIASTQAIDSRRQRNRATDRRSDDLEKAIDQKVSVKKVVEKTVEFETVGNESKIETSVVPDYLKDNKVIHEDHLIEMSYEKESDTDKSKKDNKVG